MPSIQAICEVWAPAKLNLYLEVLGRRDDGYHQLETLMTPIGLYDTLRFKVTREPEVRLQWRAIAGHGWSTHPRSAPLAEANLVVRAANAIRAAGNVTLGAEMELIKRIPVGAGLGGGSSDAAAALLAANDAWGTSLNRAELSRIALELGSDVPFFVDPVAGLYGSRGELRQKTVHLPNLHFVVVAPPEPNLTAEVFARFRPVATAASFPSVGPESARMTDRQIGALLFNRLQRAASDLNPSVERVCVALHRCGLRHCGMTGSGSACFALAANRCQANRIAAMLRNQSVGQVFSAPNVKIGMRPIEVGLERGVPRWK